MGGVGLLFIAVLGAPRLCSSYFSNSAGPSQVSAWTLTPNEAAAIETLEEMEEVRDPTVRQHSSSSPVS